MSAPLPKRTRKRIAAYQAGLCIWCPKPRGNSPYKLWCEGCGLKHRLRMQKVQKTGSWSGRGKRGRPPYIKEALIVRRGILGGELVDRIGTDGKRERVSGKTNLEKWREAGGKRQAKAKGKSDESN